MAGNMSEDPNGVARDESLPANAPASHQEAEPSEHAEPAPPPRRGRFWQKFTLLLALVGLLLTGAGFAVFSFRDKDERLNDLAREMESAGKDPAAAVSNAASRVTAWASSLFDVSEQTAPKPAAPRPLTPSVAPLRPAPVAAPHQGDEPAKVVEAPNVVEAPKLAQNAPAPQNETAPVVTQDSQRFARPRAGDGGADQRRGRDRARGARGRQGCAAREREGDGGRAARRRQACG